MNCPIDNTELRITDRQGIEVDYCPKCRGVWLDRGELDKLIERAATTPAFLSRDDDRDRYRRDDDDRDRDRDRDRGYRDDDRDRDYPGDRPYRKSKRRSLLEDLFDID